MQKIVEFVIHFWKQRYNVQILSIRDSRYRYTVHTMPVLAERWGKGGLTGEWKWIEGKGVMNERYEVMD